MGGLCEKPSMSMTLLACLPSQLYQHSCRAMSVVVPVGRSNKYYVTSLQSNWGKSEGPFPSVPSPSLRKPQSGQWILDRYWASPLMSMSSKVNAGSMLLDRLPGELPSQWGPVSMGLLGKGAMDIPVKWQIHLQLTHFQTLAKTMSSTAAV